MLCAERPPHALAPPGAPGSGGRGVFRMQVGTEWLVDFKVSTALVTVCPYCNSVVGRSDKGLEDLGKVADLVESGSPLDVWLKGRFQGVPFDLTGRVQYAHPAGGVWDEWYAHFADGRWGWLAEAQGRFYLTFESPAPPDLPPFAAPELA